MAVERIGVHESTSIDFPFAVFRDELADLDPELVPIREDGSGADPASCDAFVTFTHQQRLLETDPEWVHTTLAGVEEFYVDVAALVRENVARLEAGEDVENRVV